MRLLFVFLVLIGALNAGERTKQIKPPGSVKIGNKVFSVKLVRAISDGKEFSGITRCDKLTIEVLDSSDPMAVVETFFHEVMHAFGCENGIANDTKFNNTSDAGDNSHPGIYFAAGEWARFLFYNPEVFKWLLKLQKEKELEVVKLQEILIWAKERQDEHKRDREKN